MRDTKIIPQLKDLDYVDRVQDLKLPSLQYIRQRGDMIDTLKSNWWGEAGSHTILCLGHLGMVIFKIIQ